MERRTAASMDHKLRFSRRGMIRGSAAAWAFGIVPANVFAGPGRTPPSEKLNLAGIGVGGQGSWDLENVSSENIAAAVRRGPGSGGRDVQALSEGDEIPRFPRHARKGKRDRRGRGCDAGP